jgi:hypothetical protein
MSSIGAGRHKAGDAQAGRPAPVRRLDDGVDQGGHRGGREQQARPVRRRRLGVAGGRHADADQNGAEGGHRDEREEHAGPGEVLEQPAPDDRAYRDADPGARAPEADRASALAALREHVGEQGEGGREDQRRADPHHGAGRDQLAGAVA